MPRTIRLENWRTDGARICGNGYDDSEGFIKNGQFIRSEPIVGVIMAEDDVTCEAVETLMASTIWASGWKVTKRLNRA